MVHEPIERGFTNLDWELAFRGEQAPKGGKPELAPLHFGQATDEKGERIRGAELIEPVPLLVYEGDTAGEHQTIERFPLWSCEK